MMEPGTDRREPPSYAELERIAGVGAHCWGVFGPDDHVGRLNIIGPAEVVAAAGEVTRGAVFNLCLPLDHPDPPWGGHRSGYRHHILASSRNTQDDYLDSFYLQRSTQWDGLRHHRAREFGYYGGRQDVDAGPQGTALGIEHWARRGIAGRGVVCDVARHLAALGTPLDVRVGAAISVQTLQDCLAAQRVGLRRGDVLLVRTGYVDTYLDADRAVRVDLAAHTDNPGLSGAEEMAEFLWDSGVAAVVTDNPAVEVVPGSAADGSLHRRLIPLLGFALGELFDLRALAADCAAEGRFTCLFVAAPLNLPGGVGSPGNAVALK